MGEAARFLADLSRIIIIFLSLAGALKLAAQRAEITHSLTGLSGWLASVGKKISPACVFFDDAGIFLSFKVR